MRACAYRPDRAFAAATPRIACRMLLALLVCASGAGVAAQPAGPSLPLQAESGVGAVPDTAHPPACGAQNASLDALLAEVPRCQTDAEFLAQLGFLLNAQGRYTEALDHQAKPHGNNNWRAGR